MRHFKNISLLTLLTLLLSLGPPTVEATAFNSQGGSEIRLIKLYWQADQVDSLMLDRPFDSLSVSETINELLTGWYESGFYYARATVDSATLRGNDVSIYLAVALGPAVRIGSYRIAGLKYSNVDFLKSLLANNVGQLLTKRHLKLSERFAQKIGYVQFIPPVIVEPLEGFTAADLLLNFRERRRVSIFGGLGYSAESSQELLWQLSATFRNLLGKGRELWIESDRRDTNRQTLNLSYHQPTIWFGRGDFEINLSSRDYRDQFSEFALSMRQSSQVGEQAVLAVGTGFKRVEPADSTTGFSRYDLSLRLELSNIAKPNNPASGYSLVSSVSYSHRRYSSDSLASLPEKMVIGESRAEFTIDYYQSVSSKSIIRLKAGYIGFESSESKPPLSELFLLGGPGSLRGYRNDRFAVSRAGLFTVEPRLRFDRSFLFGFYDALWMAQSELSTPTATDIKNYYHSYGVGFSLQGESSRVMLSLGWQPELGIDQPRLSVELQTDL